MKISKLSIFAENWDTELQVKVPGFCVHCCFDIAVVIISINDGPEATHDAEIVTTLWRN